MMATWTLDYANSYQNGWSITFMGDKGTMILDEYGYKVFAEPWKPECRAHLRRKGARPGRVPHSEFPGLHKEPQTTELPGGYRRQSRRRPAPRQSGDACKKAGSPARRLSRLLNHAARIGSGPFSSDTWQNNRERRSLAGNAIDLDFSTVLTDGIQTTEETQRGSNPAAIFVEGRIENSIPLSLS